MEVGGNELNFLEVKIIKKDDGMIFDWYHKPSFSRRLLNFHSQHPITHEKGVVTSLIDKVLSLSHPDFQQKNFTLMTKLLLDNAYPLEFIFGLIRKRLITKFHQFNTQEPPIKNKDNNINKYFVMPYIGSTSENLCGFSKIYIISI